MAIIDLYSKRRAALERASDDVYSYDEIPTPLRSQLKQMYEQAYDDSQHGRATYSHFKLDYNDFKELVGILRREYGLDRLTSRSSDFKSELYSFIDSCTTERFLDCVEIYGAMVKSQIELAAVRVSACINEVNHRFKEAGLGYEHH